ncbi:reverse transcriptase domain, reverse transcriptase zinc-binding domain protein [Tanacetum coccineum]
MWFDRWADGCPLRDKLTVRNIVRSGLLLTDKVRDLISNGIWRWPSDWYDRFPDVVSIHVPPICESRDDCLVWRDNDGVNHPFSVALAWDCIRTRANNVDWFPVVWFSHCVPRHLIHLWLVIRNKLKTQDRLKQWDVGLVWLKIRILCGMDSIDARMDDILAFLIPISKGRSVVSIIARVVVATTTYFLWKERNSRLFSKKILSIDNLVESICSTVRLKLVTFKFKKISSTSRLLLDLWKVPKK